MTNNRITRSILFLLVLSMLMSLCACGSTAPQSTPAPASEPENTPESVSPAEETAAPEEAASVPEAAAEAQGASGNSILVLYFSRTGEQYNVGVIEKGNTAIVAEMIGEATGADLYEILPADDHYPMTYKELTDVGLQEQRDHARPAYAGELPDMSKYDTVFIGSPVWWGDWPMILYTVWAEWKHSAQHIYATLFAKPFPK